MRPLSLHVSALSDPELALYTASLADLTPDTDYDRPSVGARELRAWLRGRYSSLPPDHIDSILDMFCPDMLPSDRLTGGQFFAALRLVIHAESGKTVDRTLAFVQASPKPLSPPKRLVQAPPPHPDRQKPTPETNPFTHRLPPADPEQCPPQRANRISHNPSLARDQTVPSVNHGKLPPLPPRKPSLLAAPPRRPSDAVPSPITSTASLTTPSRPPLIPVKPTHVMSPLMKQSLEASKHAHSLKRAEEQLDRERVLQVLKTTSSTSAGPVPCTRTRSLSPSKLATNPSSGHGSGRSDDTTDAPPLPMRRKPSLPSSKSSSVLSLEQVASATLVSRPPLPHRDPHADHAGPGPIRPPTHPHRRSSVSTEPVNDPPSPSSPRTARSKSVTTPSAPPPPPRRKRPESMQLTPTSDAGDPFPLPLTHAPTHGVSRHLSLTRGRERDSPMAHIQKTLSNLQLRAQPKLDAVRYKAEAGISKRGYVQHAPLAARWREEGEQGLIADIRWAATNVDRDPDDDPMTDDDGSSEQKASRVASSRDILTESDNLKWPMGEGWKQL